MTRQRLRMMLVIALGTVTLAALHELRSAGLSAPPMRSWATVDAWYTEAGAGAPAAVIVRLLAMLAVGWVVLAATLQLVASVSLSQDIRRVADVVSPLGLRRLAHLSVTAGLAVRSLAGAPGDDPPGTAVMEVVDGVAESSTTTTPPPTAAPRAPAASAAPVAAAPTHEEVVVVVGESFWSIAVEAIAEARGTEPADHEVDAYWRLLVDANRARLVDPGNPDLLFPGQSLVLPALTT